MHTALALQAEGWKSVYLNEMLVTGLAPMDFSSYSCAAAALGRRQPEDRPAAEPAHLRGLSVAQRICYFASMYHWTIGFAKVVFYLRAAADPVHRPVPDRELRSHVRDALSSRTSRRWSAPTSSSPRHRPHLHGRDVQHGELLHAAVGGEAICLRTPRRRFVVTSKRGGEAARIARSCRTTRWWP